MTFLHTVLGFFFTIVRFVHGCGLNEKPTDEDIIEVKNVSQKRCDEVSIKKKKNYFGLNVYQRYIHCVLTYRLTPVHDGTHCEFCINRLLFI
jgi:hypothetical protein